MIRHDRADEQAWCISQDYTTIWYLKKMYAIFNKYKIFYNGTKKYFAIQIKSSD